MFDEREFWSFCLLQVLEPVGTDTGDLAGWDLGALTPLGDLIRELSDNKLSIFCLVRFVNAEKWLKCLEGGEGTEMCRWDERLCHC